jgi:hypothetical protein
MPPTFILNTLSELSRLRFPTPITRRTHIAVYLRSLSLYLGSHTRPAPDRWHVLVYACQSRSSSIKAVRISLPARVAAVILRNTLFHNIGFTLEISGLVAAVAHHGRRTRRRRRHRNWGVRLATPYSVDVCPCVTVSLSLVAVCLVSRSHTAYSGGAVLCLLAARAIWVHSILRMAVFP